MDTDRLMPDSSTERHCVCRKCWAKEIVFTEGVPPVDRKLYRNEQVGEVKLSTYRDVGNIGGVEPQEGGNEQPLPR